MMVATGNIAPTFVDMNGNFLGIYRDYYSVPQSNVNAIVLKYIYIVCCRNCTLLMLYTLTWKNSTAECVEFKLNQIQNCHFEQTDL